MKKEARLLKNKALASLTLSVDHFNRPWDLGRTEAVLLFLDHSFEMLLKSAIVARGGRIREKGQKMTVGFDACVRKALSDGSIKFINDEQALTLQAINGLRDAAQHHLLELSEGHLYLHAQSGITLFRDILKAVFAEDLSALLPDRSLPIATVAPTSAIALFAEELREVQRLLAPGTRRRMEAKARLRGVAIVDKSVQGEKLQPDDLELNRIERRIAAGEHLDTIFPGIASIELTATGSGPSLSLRLTKKEGIPIHLVPEGTEGAAVIGVKRVDELGYYNLGHVQLAAKAGIGTNKLTALVWYLNLQSDPEAFKEFRIGRSHFKRYSQAALDRIDEELKTLSLDDVWRMYRERDR